MEIKIPRQLQNPKFRFVLLGKWNLWKHKETKEVKEQLPEDYEKLNKEKIWMPLGKAPFEKAWQAKGYKFNDPKLLKHIASGKNYGVIGGYGNLRILDIDDKKLGEKIQQQLQTFTDKTGSGGKHFFILSDYDTNHVLANELGELRANSYQVVGPGCLHPSGNKYEVVNESKIIEASGNILKASLKPYLRKEPLNTIKEGIQKDTSRSGEEMRQVVKKIFKGKSKEVIFKEMMLYSKWSSAPAAYKELTYNNAKKYVDNQTSGKTKIELPKVGKLISLFAKQISEQLKDKNILFYRIDAKDVFEIGQVFDEDKKEYLGFILMRSGRFITLIENYIIPIVKIFNFKTKRWELKPKSINKQLADTILQSQVLHDSLPKIKRLFTIPLPIFYNGELTFPKKGYDNRFKSWLPFESPDIDKNMTLDEAKEHIKYIFKEFCFETHQDYINAIAGLLTPFIRGLYKNFNTRTPVFFYKANRERAGKDYLAGCTGLTYENQTLEEPPISSGEQSNNNNEELRKKILAGMIKGRKRLHFSNNKGYINNSVFESIITASRWEDRILGRSETLEFDNELDFSLSGNTGIRFTADLANRSIFINLFLDIENANDRKFKNPNLHQWIKDNREKVLSSLYCLVKNWVDKEKPKGTVNFASFPEWAEICGGIMETVGYDNPCKIREEDLELTGDQETQGMKSFFEWMYANHPEKYMLKKEIMDLVRQSNYPVLENYNFDERSDRIKFSMLLTRFFGRIFSDIRLIRDSSVKTPHLQKIKFTKQKQEKNTNLIFSDKIAADGGQQSEENKS